MDYRQQMDVRQQIRSSGRGSGQPFQSDRASRYRRPEEPVKRNTFLRKAGIWIFQAALVILFAYAAVYCFGQMRTNIGQSMDPTLSGGDTVLINTITYQLGSPKRGDVICFKPGGTASGRSSIKRVIGLPGETIQIVDGMIQIDGKTYLESENYPVMTNAGTAADPITLDDNEYFVLGDNRNNSEDSRFSDVGLVTTDMIEGRVWYVLSPGEHRGRVS